MNVYLLPQRKFNKAGNGDFVKIKFLSDLIGAVGVSGSEEEVRGLIEAEIKGHVDEVHTDRMGNLIAHKWGQRPRVMLAAHMDEIGMIVKSIEDSGMIRCSLIGDMKPLVIVGQYVHIHTKNRILHGVVTTTALSDGWSEKDEKAISAEDLVVDTGLTKAELAKLGVETGCVVEPHQRMSLLGSDEIISGKALDNRIGCFILVELAKRMKNLQNDVYYVFTVQEEFGLFGSMMSAYKIEPDWAIVVDVTNTDEFSKAQTKRLGKGPCLTLKDSNTVTNKKLNELVRKIASEHGIPIQLEVKDTGTTDTFSISETKGGVPATLLSIPMRNMETTIGIVSKSDVKNAIDILEYVLKEQKLNLS